MLPAEAPRARRSPRPAPRALTAAALAAVGSLALVVGCGGDDDDEPAASSRQATALTVVLDPDGSGPQQPRSVDVRCDGEGDPPGCAALESVSAADLGPVAPGSACTQIYGGPDVVRIEGMLRGEPVAARLVRTDGCEIARFERVRPLLAELFPGYRPGASLRP